MTIPYLIADGAYLLAFLLDVAGVLLIAEWVLHWAPGAAMNPLRRAFFQVCFPLLNFSEKFISFRWGNFQTRGLLTAGLFFIISHFGVPWLVYFSYTLRG
jgi:uncharacterized protein YggT (Ycf19 family)